MNIEKNEDVLLRVEKLTVCYDGEPVVQDISFQVKKGEILGIVGESGSGKSMVAKAVMGLLGNRAEVAGQVWYKGENLTAMPEKILRKYRGPELGMVFQDCKSALCPMRTVGAQMYEAVSEHERVSRAEVENRAAVLMKKIGLTDCARVLGSYPFELSGGMNQRVGICTAMLLKPDLLLADEPTSALDVTVQKQVVEELLLMKKEFHTAMLLITHNIGVVRKMADRILVLQNGKVMDYGDTQKILENPESQYTRQLMDSVIRLKRREDQKL